MPIGQGSDFYDGIDRKGEREQRLLDKVYEWWDSLDEQEQWDIIADYQPENINEDTNPDEEFGNMYTSEQIEIWQRETNPASELTKEEVDGIIADGEYEERKLKGDDI